MPIRLHLLDEWGAPLLRRFVLIGVTGAVFWVFFDATKNEDFRMQVMMVALPLALGLIFLTAIRPSAGITLAILSTPLQRGFLGDWGLLLTGFVVVTALLGFVLGDRAWLERLRLGPSLPLLIAVVLMVYIGLSLYLLSAVEITGRWTAVPWVDAEGAPQLLMIAHTMAFFVLITITTTSSRLFEAAIKAVTITLAIVLVTALYEWMTFAFGAPPLISGVASWNLGVGPAAGQSATGLLPVDYHLGGVFLGWVSNAQLGNTIVTLGYIALPVLYLGTGWSRRGFWLLLVGVLFVAYATLALVIWLSTVAAAIVFWLLLSRRKGLVLYLVATTSVLVLLIVSTYTLNLRDVPGGNGQKLDVLLSPLTGRDAEDYVSISIRQEYNAIGMHMFSENPLVGKGYGSLERFLNPQSAPNILARTPSPSGSYPHNSYVQILGQLGIVGILLFGAIVLITARSLRTVVLNANNARSRALAAGLIAALVGNLVFFLGYGSWSFNVNFWLVIALGIGLGHLHNADTVLSPSDTAPERWSPRSGTTANGQVTAA